LHVGTGQRPGIDTGREPLGIQQRRVDVLAPRDRSEHQTHEAETHVRRHAAIIEDREPRSSDSENMKHS
jgi:hypothetical protein